ncbi:MAG: hypothetical protein AB7P03_11880 [Kofleriaceae bacterium]
MSTRWIVIAMLATVACSDSDGEGDEPQPVGGALIARGAVVDFETGMPVGIAASVAVSGLVPAPRITSQVSEFTIEEIPENSTFQILASAPPTHRATFSPSIAVTTSDIDGIEAPAVSEAFLAALAESFGVTPTAAKGVLFVRLTDEQGASKSGVPSSDLVIAGGVIGPKFLDADMMPASELTASSSSGWAMFFEVPVGVATFAQTANATMAIDMPSSPINAGAVTIADAKVTMGAPALPTNVSFKTTVFPIFSARGCAACHSGNGPGRDLGGLTLDGSSKLVFKELTQERATRVVPLAPETSLLLTMPSREDPPDRHPNVTFPSNLDPDYLKIFAWIKEGAKDN